jgi:hypothetical protein
VPQREGRRAGAVELLLAGVAVDALGDADDRNVLDARVRPGSATALTCPAPPSISSRSGQVRPRGPDPPSAGAAKRRVSTSFIMPKSSPGVRLSRADVELAVLAFHEARPGPATIIAPTAFVPMMCELS